MTSWWKIETTRKVPVAHLAPAGTTEALCCAMPTRPRRWRTPPEHLRSQRDCVNCWKIAVAMGIR